MNEPVIVIDFETTGLSPDSGARATEVAAVVIENQRIVAHYRNLMNAGVTIPTNVVELTGITNSMIQSAPPADVVIRELVTFIEDFPVVAHNAAFDKKFLMSELGRIRAEFRNDLMCSMLIARRVFPDAPDHKLSTLAEYVGLSSDGNFHRALSDATTTAHLWIKMENQLQDNFRLSSVPIELMRSIQSVQRDSLGDYVDDFRRNNSN